MKTLQLLLVIKLVLHSTSSAQEIPGTLINNSLDSSPFATAIQCDGLNFYTVCSDCSKILGCVGPITDSRDCSVLSPEKPFCHNGVCSAQQPNSAECPMPPFTCTGVGFFPDPSNCDIYHHCEEALAVSSVYQCPPEYVYNSETHLCKLNTKAMDCVTVQCNSDMFFLRYGASKTYFAYCQYDGTAVSSIYMLKCGEHSVFDGTGCAFVCPKEGIFKHSDPSKFYLCYYSGYKLVYAEVDCARGKEFDQLLGVCVAPS